jgi:hypothetical protein
MIGRAASAVAVVLVAGTLGACGPSGAPSLPADQTPANDRRASSQPGEGSPPGSLAVTNAYADAPTIAVDADGVVHAAWRETTDDDIVVVHRSRGRDGAWTPSQPLSDGFEVLGAPRLLGRENGPLCASWPGFPTPDGVSATGLYVRCRAGGTWTIAASAVEAAFAARVLPAVDGDGDIKVVELRSPYPLSFGPSILSPAGVIVHSASFAIDAEGRYHVVWEQLGDGGGQFHRVSVDGGDTWSATARISEEGSAGDAAAVLVADDRGGVHAAWFDSGTMLYRAWRSDQGWSAIETATVASWTRAMVVDPEGRPAIFLGRSDGVWRMTRADEGSWSPAEQIASSNGVEELAATADRQGRAELLWTTTEAVPVIRTLEVDLRPSS